MIQKKPNIVIFNPDQWRGDMLGYLGYPGAQTPNLDNIIKEAVKESIEDWFSRNLRPIVEESVKQEISKLFKKRN